MNSDTVNDAIKPFQSTGLMGERDIHKKLLELPIPTFDQEKAKHRKLSELRANAPEEAQNALKSEKFPRDSSLARQRAFIRERLKPELKAIDKLVSDILEY